jgi:hypothetical protein
MGLLLFSNNQASSSLDKGEVLRISSRYRFNVASVESICTATQQLNTSNLEKYIKMSQMDKKNLFLALNEKRTLGFGLE